MKGQNTMSKNQCNLPDDQQGEWDIECLKAASAISRLCEIYEINNMDEIKGYLLPESLDEYNLKFFAMMTRENE